MSWEFTEDAAFLALCDAYKESGEPSAMEFLAHGEGAFHFQELSQNAAGEGLDLSDSADLEEFQQEVILVLQSIPASLSEPGIKHGLFKVLGPGLDDPVAHRFFDAAAGALALELHHLVVKGEHLRRNRGAIEIEAGLDRRIDAIGTCNCHGVWVLGPPRLGLTIGINGLVRR